MSRWLRINEDCIDNPKILKLPEALRWQWVALLCVASKNDGVLPPIDDVALCLRVTEAKAAEFITKLVRARLIDCNGDTFSPHNWNKRQYKSDSSSDRVAKYREKRRAAGLPQMGDYSSFKPALIKRDGEHCVYCLETSGLVVDHMTPITLGGTDHIDNLALACKPCNSGKAGRTPEMAKKPIIVTSAMDALNRYRDMVSDVTVTLTAPEAEAKAETESEQSRTDAGALSNEDLGRKVLALQTSVSLAFSTRGMPVPALDRCGLWISQGYGQGTVLGAVDRVLKRGKAISTLDYFDAAIREDHARAPVVPAVPQIVSIQEFIIEGTLEWSCWERHLRETTGRGSPVTDNRDEAGRVRRGWFRPTRVPPGYDEATGEKLAPTNAEDAA